MKRCTIDGCEDLASGRGWCVRHYTRWRRYGDPKMTVRLVGKRGQTQVDRFWSFVAVRAVDECWEWKLARMRKGYGRFALGGSTNQSEYAHRFSYQLTHGPTPEGHEIHHRCENKICVNPNHLEAMTVADHRALGWGRTACPHGHDYTEENTYVDRKGVKTCKTCRRIGRPRRAA